ncbi:MAG: GNAT family N-acetyltransferase [Roseiflexaceae bacterium]|nr:GNAT family N-acetyltransferase [Roseiflexaceae bacterium]
MSQHNQLGQPVGQPLPDWQPPLHPPRMPIQGQYCTVAPFDLALHATALFAANSQDDEGRMWTYLSGGPFDSLAAYHSWMGGLSAGNDPQFYTIIDHQPARAVGVAAYLRIAPAAGSIEVGHLAFSPLLQRQPAATEAMFLMMQHAFELGYRRYEWKCDALNMRSRAAAQRLGFSFEGVFRQAGVYKGRNRDTAWFSVLDSEWPALHQAFTRWLAPANLADGGPQRESLRALTAPLLAQRDPVTSSR